MTNSDVTSSVVRSSAQISAITSLARIVGFARWIVLGYAVGTTYLGNVYQTANLIPNVMFELVAGGMLASVLVPTFVRQMEEDASKVSDVASSLANLLLLVTVPLVIAGMAFSRPLMSVLLIGVDDPVTKARQVELGSWFLLFFLPQVPLYLLGIVMQGLLHAHRRFIVPALGPLLSSLTVIATYLVFRAMQPDATLHTVERGPLVVLAGGTTLGVVVLALCQWPSVRRLGIRWKPVLRRNDPIVRSALRAGGWGAGFLGVTQLMMLVAVMLANRVEGGVVAFQIANAFFELPNALIGLPVAISLFPALSEAYVRSDESRFANLLNDGWRLLLFGAVPAAVGLFLLAPMATEVMLGWASDVDPGLVGATLQGLAIGVVPWLMISLLVRTLYARGATARPFVLNLFAFLALAGVGVGLTAQREPQGRGAMGLIGTAVASGWWIAALLGVAMFVRLARGWTISDAVRPLFANVARAGLMGLAVWGVLRALEDAVPDAVTLVVAVLVGVAVVALTGFRSRELRGTLAFLGGRRQTRTTGGAPRATPSEDGRD